MSTVALQAVALGDPSGWGGEWQQDQEPKITSTLAATASLTSLQVHAEPSAQAPLSSAPSMESPLTSGRRQGVCLAPNTRADPLRDPCSHISHHPVQKKTQTQGLACVWDSPHKQT